MKKKFCVAIVLIFSFAKLFSHPYSEKTVVIEAPDVSALSSSKSELESLKSIIKSDLAANLRTYLEMQITGNAEDTRLASEILRRESESNAYDESSGPEIGSFLRSYYSVVTKVSKIGSEYKVSVTLRDLTTNTSETVTTKNIYPDIKKLCSHPGAIDEITILLCDKLNITLSPHDRRALKEGEQNLNTEDQITRNKSQLEALNRRMEELQKQQDAMRSSTELNAENQQKLIAAQIEDLKQRQKQKEETADRLASEKKKQEEEKLANEERSEEQKRRILQEAREAERIASEIRASKIESASLYTRFILLEDKKEVLLTLDQKMKQRCNEIKAEGEKEIKEKRQKILSAPYRQAEKSNGKPTEEAVAFRKSEADAREREVRAEMERHIQETEVPFKKQMNELVEEIVDDYIDLESRTFITSTIKDPDSLAYIVDDFDRKKMGWPVKFYFSSDGRRIGNFKTVIPYKELYEAIVDESAPTPESNYNGFCDTVDRYQSHFANKANIIEFILTYESQPDRNKASRYNTRFKKLEMVSVKTRKKFHSQTEFDNKEDNFGPAWTFTFNANLKPVESFISDCIKQRELAIKKEEARRRAEEEKALKERKNAERKKNFEEWNQSRSGIFIDAGMGGNKVNEGILVEVSALFPYKRFFFFGGDFEYHIGDDMTHHHEHDGYYELALLSPELRTIRSTDVMRFQALAGTTITWRRFRPYLLLGLGYFMNSYSDDAVIYAEDSRSGGILASGFCFKVSPGIDVKIKKLSLGLAYDLQVDFGAGANDYFKLSVGYKFW